MIQRWLLLVLLFLPLTACRAPTSPPPTTAPAPSGLTLLPGYQVTVVAQGLRGPTQMTLGPDGRLWVAQLAGGENDGTGQLVALDLDTGALSVLLDGLFKPTGFTVLGESLWLASGNDLLRAPLRLEGTSVELGPPEPILSDLPFNGRSNGTLTPAPDGTLLYETSGRRTGNQAAEGAATLWRLDPSAPASPRPVATGLKGAYAHTFDGAGRLWITEIGDDAVNEAPPPDELNLVVEGADFGWPACFGAQEAARNFGGTAERCQATRAPVVTFPPRSTPTSVVPSPWEPETLLVALWGPATPRVVRVPVTLTSDNAIGRVEPFLSGLEHPQHLLVLPDGSLLVSDFGTGTIYRISRAG